MSGASGAVGGYDTGTAAVPPAGSAEGRVCASYRQGLTLRECAARHGLTMKVVLGILARNGVSRRRPGQRLAILSVEPDLITALNSGPVTLTEIATRFGVSVHVVQRVRRRIPPADRVFIRPGEAARLLGVDLRQVAAVAARAQLPEHRTPGGMRRYLRAEIHAIAGRAAAPGPQLPGNSPAVDGRVSLCSQVDAAACCQVDAAAAGEPRNPDEEESSREA